MALQRILVGDILHVAESIFSFHDTKSTYWQYDVKRWLRSRTGRAGDPPTDPMDEASIKWCKEVHLPRAVRQDDPPSSSTSTETRTSPPRRLNFRAFDRMLAAARR